MDLAVIMKVAMAHKDIKSKKALSELSGVSYYKVNELLNGGKTVSIGDLATVLSCLDIEIKYVSRGV